jgi:plasmid stabilization system protein ParE
MHGNRRLGGGDAMPREWSKKRERQYEHVKESYEDKSVSKKEAERRAAATVNKSRSKKGETKS